jgi:hypothetical protein
MYALNNHNQIETIADPLEVARVSMLVHQQSQPQPNDLK